MIADTPSLKPVSTPNKLPDEKKALEAISVGSRGTRKFQPPFDTVINNKIIRGVFNIGLTSMADYRQKTLEELEDNVEILADYNLLNHISDKHNVDDIAQKSLHDLLDKNGVPVLMPEVESLIRQNKIIKTCSGYISVSTKSAIAEQFAKLADPHNLKDRYVYEIFVTPEMRDSARIPFLYLHNKGYKAEFSEDQMKTDEFEKKLLTAEKYAFGKSQKEIESIDSWNDVNTHVPVGEMEFSVVGKIENSDVVQAYSFDDYSRLVPFALNKKALEKHLFNPDTGEVNERFLNSVLEASQVKINTLKKHLFKLNTVEVDERFLNSVIEESQVKINAQEKHLFNLNTVEVGERFLNSVVEESQVKINALKASIVDAKNTLSEYFKKREIRNSELSMQITNQNEQIDEITALTSTLSKVAETTMDAETRKAWILSILNTLKPLVYNA